MTKAWPSTSQQAFTHEHRLAQNTLPRAHAHAFSLITHESYLFKGRLTHAQEINASQLPIQLSLSQPAKTLGPSYYCLYSLYNKIRDKGKIVSAR
jgi:hypothetical protein